jgi:hypothetical protein
MIRSALTILTLGAALTAAGSSAQNAGTRTPEAKLARTLHGLTPQAPTNCIDSDLVTEIETYKDTIIYIRGRNKVWRNDTSPGCTGLRRGDLVVSRGSLNGRYCSGDRVETRSRAGGMVTGACALGDFTPYTK